MWKKVDPLLTSTCCSLSLSLSLYIYIHRFDWIFQILKQNVENILGDFIFRYKRSINGIKWVDIREFSIDRLFSLESLNSCQTSFLSNSDALCPYTTPFDSELYIYHTFANLTYLTSIQYALINEYFHLEYSRDETLNSLTLWRPYRLSNSQLNPPIIAKHLRIKTNHCLQLQIFGCVFTDGVVSYNVLQGAHQLEDDTYDGFYNEKHRYLYDGLGQLTDGQTGPDNYQDELGFQWVKAKQRERTNLSFVL